MFLKLPFAVSLSVLFILYIYIYDPALGIARLSLALGIAQLGLALGIARLRLAQGILFCLALGIT